MNNQNLLSQSYNQIYKGVFGEGAVNFQMLAKPMNFSWPVAAPGQMSPAAYQLIKIMPKYSDVASYDPGDATFFDAYKSLLSHITFKVSPEKQNDLNNLKNQWNQALVAVTTAETAANTAYLTAKQNGGAIFAAKNPDILAWLKGAGSAFDKAIDVATKSANTLGDDYADKLASLLSGNDRLKEAMKAIQLPIDLPGASASPRGWTKVPNTAGDLVWQPSFDIGTSGQDWRAKLAGGSEGAFTVNLDASNSESNFKKSWAGGSASYGSFFWGVRASGGWEKMDLNESDSSVKVTISVKSSTLVPVTPGVWYDGGFMKDLVRNADGSGYKIEQGWTAKGGTNNFFGKDGLLSCRINQLLVVYKPSFEITMNSSTFQKNEQKINASAGLRIGPFTFGGSGGHQSTYVKSTQNGTTFKGEDTSDDPLIIGLTVAFPGE